VNPFFDDLGRRLAEAAAREGVSIEAPGLDGEVARELLELARVAAHTQERRFAPLSTYLAGMAVDRLGSTDPAVVARLVRAVREDLEKESTPSERG
jgi:uncharacterized protein DUF6457